MTAIIIPPNVLEAKRQERERQRREREAFAGSILSLIDDEPDQPVCVASEAKETTR